MRARLRQLFASLSFRPKLQQHNGEQVMMIENRPVLFPKPDDAAFFVAAAESMEPLLDELDRADEKIAQLAGFSIDELLVRITALTVELAAEREKHQQTNAALRREVEARTSIQRRAMQLTRVAARIPGMAKQIAALNGELEAVRNNTAAKEVGPK